ncbi:methylated-DNA--[protein]-cysteine S-methyltransferase [Paenibacillus sp. MBLB4367]|uniref:methylated-DNA--[protein]-cysteine S-methyltransferase n=1 Tax=Paenibacillus sp. MBLB4367 TaxID=3384767 RepID=UPI0039083B88
MRTQLNWVKLMIEGRDWLLLATEFGVCRVIFPHEGLKDFQGWLDRYMPGVEPKEDPAALRRTGAIDLLQAYFAGERVSFAELPLDLIGTSFQREVWTALGRVPYGEIRTYRDIAEMIGRPNAVRAVGAANGANPLPVFLPCHRIIGADRKLTGFRGGLTMKSKMLKLEGIEDVEDGGHARFRF